MRLSVALFSLLLSSQTSFAQAPDLDAREAEAARKHCSQGSVDALSTGREERRQMIGHLCRQLVAQLVRVGQLEDGMRVLSPIGVLAITTERGDAATLNLLSVRYSMVRLGYVPVEPELGRFIAGRTQFGQPRDEVADPFQVNVASLILSMSDHFE